MGYINIFIRIYLALINNLIYKLCEFQGGNATLKNLIINNKIWVGITAGIYSVLLFVLSGSLGLIKNSSTSFVNLETNVSMTKGFVIRDFLTIGNFGILAFFVVIAIVCAVFFRDKEAQFKARINDKESRVMYFKESLILLLTPIFIGIVINFLIRSLLFIMNQEILSLGLEISYFSAINTYLYILALALLGVSMNFLFQVGVKSVFSAAIIPMFMFEGLILIFGVSNLFTSGKIPLLLMTSNFISDLVENYINLFYSDLRIEMLGMEVFSITILACIAITTVFLATTCRYLVIYDEKRLKYKYRFITIRRVVLVEMVTLVVMYSSIAIFGGIAFLNSAVITIEQSFIYTNIATIVLVIPISIGMDILYRKKYKIVNNKKVKRAIKKITENEDECEYEYEQVNLEIDDNLSSKGIIKETKTAKHKTKEKDLGETRGFRDEEVSNIKREVGFSFIEEEGESEVFELRREEELDFMEIDIDKDDFFSMKNDDSKK